MKEENVNLIWDGVPFLDAFANIEKAIRYRSKEEVPQWKIQFGGGLITIGNTALGALFFGQIINENNFNGRNAVLGIFICITTYLAGIILMKKR